MYVGRAPRHMNTTIRQNTIPNGVLASYRVFENSNLYTPHFSRSAAFLVVKTEISDY